MNNNNNENIHPADELLDVAVNAIDGAETPADAVAVLGQMAGSVEDAFLNVANNTPELALRMLFFKNLLELHEKGDDAGVMEILNLASKASLVLAPESLDEAIQEYRDHYDRDFGS